MQNYSKIFRQGSTTYFFSSLFFPKYVLQKVTLVYAWVRTADDYVDSVPQNAKGFESFCSDFEKAWVGKKSTQLHSDFVQLAKSHEFEKAWLDAFLFSMRWDLSKKKFSFSQLQTYMYGSAEVIGLMMNRVMGVDKRLDSFAQDLGRSMQLINFIRDVKEDTQLGRTYLQKDSSSYISYYKKWDASARKSFSYLPYRYRVPIKTAADMYLWCANKIEKNPQIPYLFKLKPSKLHILVTGVLNGITQIFQGKNKKSITNILNTKS